MLFSSVARVGFFEPNWFYSDRPWFGDGVGFFLVFFHKTLKFYKNSPRIFFCIFRKKKSIYEKEGIMKMSLECLLSREGQVQKGSLRGLDLYFFLLEGYEFLQHSTHASS